MIYKFVKWDIQPLETFCDSSEYRIHEKIEKGEALTREERDFVFRGLQHNSRSKVGLPLGGWMFDLREHLITFLVKLKHSGWQEVYALDKTSIRLFYGSQTLKIMEVN